MTDVAEARAETEARIALMALTQPQGDALNPDVDVPTAAQLIHMAIADINEARFGIRSDEVEAFRSPVLFAVGPDLVFRWRGVTDTPADVITGFVLLPVDDMTPARSAVHRLAAWVWTAQEGDEPTTNNEKRFQRLNHVLDVLESMRAWILERRAWARDQAAAGQPYRGR